MRDSFCCFLVTKLPAVTGKKEPFPSYGVGVEAWRKVTNLDVFKRAPEELGEHLASRRIACALRNWVSGRRSVRIRRGSTCYLRALLISEVSLGRRRTSREATWFPWGGAFAGHGLPTSGIGVLGPKGGQRQFMAPRSFQAPRAVMSRGALSPSPHNTSGRVRKPHPH